MTGQVSFGVLSLAAPAKTSERGGQAGDAGGFDDALNPRDRKIPNRFHGDEAEGFGKEQRIAPHLPWRAGMLHEALQAGKIVKLEDAAAFDDITELEFDAEALPVTEIEEEPVVVAPDEENVAPDDADAALGALAAALPPAPPKEAAGRAAGQSDPQSIPDAEADPEAGGGTRRDIMAAGTTQAKPAAPVTSIASDRPAANPPANPQAATRGTETGQPAAREQTASRAPMPATDASAAPQPRVTVVGAQNAPAPATPAVLALNPTAASVVGAIEAEPVWRSVAQEAAANQMQRGTGTLASVSTLKIQLHPAELGVVTARLTATGSQLSIEIQVDNSDARHRLANDSEAIVKALRSLGYDVDKITIQQTANTSANNGQASSGRDLSFSNQQASGEGGEGRKGGGGQSQQSGDEARNAAMDGMAERASGGGIYI
ncbi:flagellar hook-length control protein FliK [Aquamicrobium sp. LC103]|uniref:flagellar hook-length control protein FliK n=1 Tax=Aquamicrobium sp. LC103 TaxID=1120658 RepID=UPI00069B00D5|nr:flagellar hook-length control protein FliK [Aquamicrobium sp. LC103]TKT77495.1 hypothetical protein XW59_013575 [Aquamicrobium sp. LC103]